MNDNGTHHPDERSQTHNIRALHAAVRVPAAVAKQGSYRDSNQPMSEPDRTS